MKNTMRIGIVAIFMALSMVGFVIAHRANHSYQKFHVYHDHLTKSELECSLKAISQLKEYQSRNESTSWELGCDGVIRSNVTSLHFAMKGHRFEHITVYGELRGGEVELSISYQGSSRNSASVYDNKFWHFAQQIVKSSLPCMPPEKASNFRVRCDVLSDCPAYIPTEKF